MSFCMNYIENDYHIIFECPSYNDLRSTPQLPIDYSVTNKEYTIFSITLSTKKQLAK